MKFQLDEKEKCTEVNYLYRYEDDYDQIRLREFRIVKETSCGWWINKWPWHDKNNLKFVYKTGKNNFAKKTKKEAAENYYHRKHRHISILKHKLELTQTLLIKAESILFKEKSNE
jgi:Fe-S cluster assembly scaffold protein SufB